MGCPQHDVDEVGEFTKDRGHRPQHPLDSLVGRQEPESERDELALDRELILVEIGIDERHVGDAVRDQVDLGVGDVVDVAKERAGTLGHHDQAGRELGDLTEHAALLGAGLLEHGVQRRDDRHPQVAQQADDMAAGRAAEDAVLVLEADDVGVGEIEEIGRPQVRVELLFLDLEPDFRRVVVTLGNVVDRHDEAIRAGILGGDRRAEVVGEGRDAALSRQVIADERDLLDLAVPFHRGCRNPKETQSLGPRARRNEFAGPAIQGRIITRRGRQTKHGSRRGCRGCRNSVVVRHAGQRLRAGAGH